MGKKWWVFEMVTPLTSIFFWNPHLPKINPAYAPGSGASIYVFRGVEEEMGRYFQGILQKASIWTTFLVSLNLGEG